jgi:hypothetical protein
MKTCTTIVILLLTYITLPAQETTSENTGIQPLTSMDKKHRVGFSLSFGQSKTDPQKFYFLTSLNGKGCYQAGAFAMGEVFGPDFMYRTGVSIARRQLNWGFPDSTKIGSGRTQEEHERLKQYANSIKEKFYSIDIPVNLMLMIVKGLYIDAGAGVSIALNGISDYERLNFQDFHNYWYMSLGATYRFTPKLHINAQHMRAMSRFRKDNHRDEYSMHTPWLVTVGYAIW